MRKSEQVDFIARDMIFSENFLDGFSIRMYHALYGKFDSYNTNKNVVDRIILLKDRLDKYVNTMIKYSDINHIFEFLHNDCGVIGTVYAQTTYAIDISGRRRSIQEWVWRKGWTPYWKDWDININDIPIITHLELPNDDDFYARAMIVFDSL